MTLGMNHDELPVVTLVVLAVLPKRFTDTRRRRFKTKLFFYLRYKQTKYTILQVRCIPHLDIKYNIQICI